MFRALKAYTRPAKCEKARARAVKCPHCREKLLQKSGDATRLRTDGPVVFDASGCRSRCYWCKADVRLPLMLNPQDAPQPARSHVIRVMRKSEHKGQ